MLLALKYLRKHPLQSDRPLLNERAVQHIGQSFDLIDPIVNGRGSVKIGDSDLAGGGTGAAEGRAGHACLAPTGRVLKVTPA